MTKIYKTHKNNELSLYSYLHYNKLKFKNMLILKKRRISMNYLQKGTKEFTLANLALFAAGFITFANLYITQPLFPQFTKTFGVSPATASLSLSFYWRLIGHSNFIWLIIRGLGT